MRRPYALVLIVVTGAILGTTAGCASAPPAEQSGETVAPSRPQRRSSTLITREELTESNARDAYQAVQMLRPDWLRGRGATSLSGGVPEVVVYLDGQRVGTRNILAQFAVISIKELRFHSATDATQRWGTGHSGGVIEVVTR